MLVTFTNPGSSAVLVQSLYHTLEAGASVTTRRAWSDLDRDQPLKALVQAGTITLAFTKEPGDDASLGPTASSPSYTNTTRPAANTIPSFSPIWNTSDNAPNWSDGVNWRDAEGNIT